MTHTHTIKGGYLLPLTGLRGLAAFLVVLSHLPDSGLAEWPSSSYGGRFSVMLFFCLSGFLMGYLYCFRPFTVESTLQYGIARFSRIAPAYLVAILLCFLIFQFIDPEFPIQITTDLALRHFLFMGNQGIFWSIPPEVQFYALFVLFWYAFYCWHAKQKITPMLFFLGCSIVVIALRENFPGTFVGSKLAYFLLGTLLGIGRYHLEKAEVSIKGMVALQVVVFLFGVYGLSGPMDRDMSMNGFWNDLSNAFLAGFIVLVFSVCTRFADLLFSNKPMQLLGIWSFSLYLTHAPVLHYTVKFIPVANVWVLTVIAVSFSVLFSWFFYEVVEKPGIKVLKQGLQYAVFEKGAPLLKFTRNKEAVADARS